MTAAEKLRQMTEKLTSKILKVTIKFSVQNIFCTSMHYTYISFFEK